MHYLTVDKDLTLSTLASIVGERNVDTVLNANGIMERSVAIGTDFINRAAKVDKEYPDIDYQQKLHLLNQFVGDSDLYEKTALGNVSSWKNLAVHNCFPDAMKIPDDVEISESEGVLGNGERVPDRIYRQCTESLRSDRHWIDPAIFAEYNASFSGGSFGVTSTGYVSTNTPLDEFKFPWGEICLYSSISGEMLQFPVYPNEIDDGVSANYEDMGEMLYQYEPWKVYKSSGPRELSFTFDFHRDMWTWDHRDGNANHLVKGCKANCYPRYNGSLVNVPIVTLYLHGQNFITGVMTSCKDTWDGPIGLDGFYLHCVLSFSITEISPEALNYDTVRHKGLIS